jgi:hypothetical protein
MGVHEPVGPLPPPPAAPPPLPPAPAPVLACELDELGPCAVELVVWLLELAPGPSPPAPPVGLKFRTSVLHAPATATPTATARTAGRTPKRRSGMA